MVVLNMGILKEENAQGSAELILIFGGIIVIAIAAAWFYKGYLQGMQGATNSDVNSVNGKLQNLTTKIKNS